jgi:CHAT domain-containing protein
VGQLLRAEGTLGFTWAFLSAGSSAIVASQWSVNDRSTAQIMEAFYSGMSHGLSPTAALRAAKLAMLDSERAAFRHPYYWAPFVLVGAGSQTVS